MNDATARDKICEIIRNVYHQYSYIRNRHVWTDADRNCFDRVLDIKVGDSDVTSVLYQLSGFLCRYYGKKAIILMDEYDAPMQEAYASGYWEEIVPLLFAALDECGLSGEKEQVKYWYDGFVFGNHAAI